MWTTRICRNILYSRMQNAIELIWFREIFYTFQVRRILVEHSFLAATLFSFSFVVSQRGCGRFLVGRQCLLAFNCYSRRSLRCQRRVWKFGSLACSACFPRCRESHETIGRIAGTLSSILCVPLRRHDQEEISLIPRRLPYQRYERERGQSSGG